MRKIDKFIENESNITSVACDIVEMFDNQATTENLNCDFNIAKISGRMKDEGPNTNFVSDIPAGTKLKELQLAIFDEDLEYEEEGYPDIKVSVSKEEAAEIEVKIQNLMKRIGDLLTTDYAKEIRTVVRRILMPDTDDINLPLDPLKVEAIEVADWSAIPEPSKYLLRIGKFPGAHIDTGQVVQFIQEQQEIENKTAEEVFDDNKDKNDMFKGIASVETVGKFVFEFSMSLFIDYSYAKIPPRLDAPEVVKN